MGWYDTYVMPHLIDLVCGAGDVEATRREVVPQATGRVLEVGMGPALNLPFYDRDRVELVWGVEPSEGMRRKAADRIEQSDLDVRWLDHPGEAIPLDDHSADTVVLTYTLCSIAGAETALAEMRRVLKPSGVLLFCEHGRSPDADVRRRQDRIDPFWTRVAGGCHVNRPIVELIGDAGFSIDRVDAEYRPGPKFASYLSTGAAHPS